MVVMERVTPSGVVLPDQKIHGGLGFERMFDCFCYEGMEREETQARFFLKPKQTEKNRVLLVGIDTTDKFRLEKMTVNGVQTFETDNYGIVLVTSGSGYINGQSAKAGERFFLPYVEKSLVCDGNMKFLFCSAVG